MSRRLVCASWFCAALAACGDAGGGDLSDAGTDAPSVDASDASQPFVLTIEIIDDAVEGELEVLADGTAVSRVEGLLLLEQTYPSFEDFVFGPYIHVVTRVGGEEVFSADITDVCLDVCRDGCATIAPVLHERFSIVLEADATFVYPSNACVACEGPSQARYRCI